MKKTPTPHITMQTIKKHVLDEHIIMLQLYACGLIYYHNKPTTNCQFKPGNAYLVRIPVENIMNFLAWNCYKVKVHKVIPANRFVITKTVFVPDDEIFIHSKYPKK